MSAPTREQIAAAFFSVVQTAVAAVPSPNTPVTVSRRLEHWEDVGSEQQPAVFVAQRGQVRRDTVSGRLLVNLMDFDVYVYVTETDHSQTPATKLNAIVDAMETAFRPGVDGEPQTLSGLVQYTEVTKVETDEGTLGDQAVALVSVTATYPTT